MGAKRSSLGAQFCSEWWRVAPQARFELFCRDSFTTGLATSALGKRTDRRTAGLTGRSSGPKLPSAPDGRSPLRS